MECNGIDTVKKFTYSSVHVAYTRLYTINKGDVSMADVIVERDSDRNTSSPVVWIVVIAVIVIAALLFLPGLLGGNKNNGTNTGTNMNTGTSTSNTTTPTTGQ